MRWRQPGRFLRDLNIIALLALIAGAASLFMFPQSDDVLLGLPDLNLGDRSPRTIRSPRPLKIADPDTTRQEQERAARQVPPVLDQEVWLVERAKRRVATAFGVSASASEDAGADETPQPGARITDTLGVEIDDRTAGALVDGSPDELRDAVLSILTTVGAQPIVVRPRDLPTGVERITLRQIDQDERVVHEDRVLTSTILTLDQARTRVDALAAESLGHLPKPQRRAAAVVAKALLDGNLVRNTLETRRRQRSARRSVKASVIAIAPGEVVVRTGQIVDAQKLRLLRGMAQELESTNRVQVSVGSALLVMLLVVFGYRLAARLYRPDRPTHRDLAFLAAAILLTMLSLWAGFHGVTFLIELTPSIPTATMRMGLPVAFGVLLVRFVAGPQVAAVFTPVVAVIAGWMMDASLAFTIYTVAGGLAAASLAEQTSWTSALLSAASRVIISQATVAVALNLLDSSFDVDTIIEHVAAATVSGATAVVLASLVVAVVEAVFGYATTLRLGQLANLNHPLLKQLLVEAPGTYHHSIMVGTLAETAAEAIGARPLLARVGGFYHDIGKLKNPRAFDENHARELGNPGDVAVQADELRNHVPDGIELAYAHRLGAAVVEIIGAHHGTARVGHRATAGTASASEEVRYPGPKPASKECGLVMIANSVDAATRNLDRELKVDEGRVRRIVDDAVQALLLDGQLDGCALTLRDLDTARRVFVGVVESRLVRRGPPTLTALSAATGASVVPAPVGKPS